MKKIVSFVLAALMVFTMLPASALAADTAVPEQNYAINTNSYMTRLRVDLDNEAEFQLGFKVHWDGEQDNRFTPQMGAQLLQSGKIQIDDGKVWSFREAELDFATEDTRSSFHTYNKAFIREFFEKDTFRITVTTPEGYTVQAENVENQMSAEERTAFKASLDTGVKPNGQYTVEPVYTYLKDNWGTQVMRIDFKEFGNSTGEKTTFRDNAVMKINGHSFGTMKSMGFTVGTYYDFELQDLSVIKDVILYDDLNIELTVSEQTISFTIKNELTPEQRQEIAGKGPQTDPETGTKPETQVVTIGDSKVMLLKSNDHAQESMSGPTMKKDAQLITSASGEHTLVLHFAPAEIMDILAYATNLKLEGCTTQFVLREDNSGVCIAKIPAFSESEIIIPGEIFSSVMNAEVALKVTKPAETSDLQKALEQMVSETEDMLKKGQFYDTTVQPVREALEAAKKPEDAIVAYTGLVKAVAGLRRIVEDPFVGDTLFHMEALDTSVIGKKSLAKYVRVEIIDGKKVLTAHYNSYLDWDGLIYMDSARVLDQDGREIPSEYHLDENKNGTLTFEMPYVPGSGIFDIVLGNGNVNEGSRDKYIETKLQMNYATIVKGPFKTLLEDAVGQYGYYTDADWSTRVPMEQRKDAYTSSSWEHFEKTLTQCKKNLELGALTQKQIDASVKELKDARMALVYKIKAGSGNTANVGTSALNSPEAPYYPSDAYAEYPEIVGWGGSKVIFGTDGAVYRVLDNGQAQIDGKTVNTGKLLLMAESLRVKKPFASDAGNVSVRWQDSLLRKYMNGEFYANNFSDVEKKAIVKSVIDSYDYLEVGFGHPSKDPATEIKTEDYIFAPSMAVMNSEQYGFGSNDSRITPQNYAMRDVLQDALGDYVVMGVSPKGRLNGMYELSSQNLEAPPCMYLDTSKILMTVDAATGIPQGVTPVKPLETNLWKFVMHDETLKLKDSYQAQVSGNTVSVDVGDFKGQLMAVVVEGDDFASGTIRAYGKIDAAGFELSDFDAAKEKLYVMEIRDENGKTAYASQPALVKIDENIGSGDQQNSETNLADGTYSVDVALWHESSDRASMGDAAFANSRQAVVTVKDGKVTEVRATTGPVAMGPIVSAITEVQVNGRPVNILMKETLTTAPAGNEVDYIKQFGFQLPDAAQPEKLEGITYVPVQFKVPDTPMGDNMMAARIKLDWSTAVKNDEIAPEKPVDPQEPSIPEKPELTELDLEDKATGIRVHADKGVFNEEVILVVTPIVSGKQYEDAAKSLDSVGKKFKLYEVHFENRKGEEIQPNGKVTVSYPIPADYDASKLALYRINEDGTKTLVSGVVENGCYQVVQKHFSTYALVEKGSRTAGTEHNENGKPNTPDTPNKPNTPNKPVAPNSAQTGDGAPVLALVSLALVSAAAIVVLVVGKKRRVK